MKTLHLAVATAAFVALGGMALAQQGGGLGQACKADLDKLCAGGGGGKGFDCLVKNRDKLAADCGTALKAAEERREKMRTACKADADKLCKDVAPKGGELVRCLRSKEKDVSAECKAAMGPQAAAAPAK